MNKLTNLYNKFRHNLDAYDNCVINKEYFINNMTKVIEDFEPNKENADIIANKVVQELCDVGLVNSDNISEITNMITNKLNETL
tara:strand:+ start:8485 stop:8736 length:252 start_codon:yes stop_codon:yes gene_type:complete